MADDTRIERDSMGEVEVPLKALYGPQTQRALDNFTISAQPMPARFIKALLLIKQAAAEVNRDLGLLSSEKAAVIILCITKLFDEYSNEHFPVPVFQTGSGTSTNMNVNEVISTMAKSTGIDISANDDVNMGQSSNDVIPTALYLSVAEQIKNSVIPALTELAATIKKTARANRRVVKTGRTHLMDALPIRLSRELEAWESQLNDDIDRLDGVLSRLSEMPLGGTAVGSGVNCHPSFALKTLKNIGKKTSITCKKSSSPYKGLSCLDTPLEVSGLLKTAAVTLMKIANDLRWMNSGPNSGLAEIILPALQPGSSIMPDKVNPVIPEAVCMAAAKVIGNDAAITIAAQAGNFQLNTMLPLVASDLLQSCELVSGAASSLGRKAIRDMHINTERMEQPLTINPVLVTALAPYIGYLEAARIAKAARRQKRPILEVAEKMTKLEPELLKKLLNPRHLADGGTPPSPQA